MAEHFCGACDDTGEVRACHTDGDFDPFGALEDCDSCPTCFGCSYPLALHGEGLEIEPGEQLELDGKLWHPACWIEYVGAMQEDEEARYQALAPIRGIGIGLLATAPLWLAFALILAGCRP